MGQNQNPKTLDPAILEWLRGEVRARGLAAAARRLDLGRNVLAQACAGGTLRDGSRAMLADRYAHARAPHAVA